MPSISLQDLVKYRGPYEYNDYAEISFTATETSYTVGTNANKAEAGSWPSGVTAKSVLLYATQDCYVRFNGNRRIQHRILSGNFYQFNLKIHTIYVKAVSTSGTLYAYFEG